MTMHKTLKTGGNPRMLPDYAALRDELSKLTHPARPDVNWQYVEKLCISLFEQNGVELQTAAWYTLARTQLTGLLGLNEGLTILEALINHQWGALWPQQVHVRMEILSSLSQRLQRLELKHLSQLDTLRTLMHNSAVRLENSDGKTSTGSSIQPGIVLPATVMNDATASTRDFAGGPDEGKPESAVKWVYVAQPEPQSNVEVLSTMPVPVKKWKSFIAGMCTMLVISIVSVWSWHFLHRPDHLQNQLARLDKLPPDWNLAYSRKLTEQAKPLAQKWQLQLNAAALPTEQLDGWHQGMMKLKQLSDRLNGLDEQKGKYMTVSELKSVVFSTMQSFNKSVPAAARAQLEMHLKQLTARYAVIQENASE